VAAGTGSDEPLGLVLTQKLALLVLDLEHAACKQKSEFDRSPQLHRTVKLMAQALRMDLQELHHDYRSVPSQLVGRLIGYESESAVPLGGVPSSQHFRLQEDHC